MNEESKSRPELVIAHRPQVSVVQLEDGDVEISTASIDAAFEGVAFDTVVIPPGDVPAVIAALQAIVDRGGVK